MGSLGDFWIASSNWSFIALQGCFTAQHSLMSLRVPLEHLGHWLIHFYSWLVWLTGEALKKFWWFPVRSIISSYFSIWKDVWTQWLQWSNSVSIFLFFLRYDCSSLSFTTSSLQNTNLQIFQIWKWAVWRVMMSQQCRWFCSPLESQTDESWQGCLKKKALKVTAMQVLF